MDNNLKVSVIIPAFNESLSIRGLVPKIRTLYPDFEIVVINDGVRFFMIIIRICTLFSPMRIFLPISSIMFFLGLFNYAISYLIKNRFTNMSMLLFISSLVIFMMGLVSEQICQMRYERARKDLLLVQPDKSYKDN